MSLRDQSKSFYYYRLIFVFLFLLMSFACIGIVALEQFAGFNLLDAGNDIDKEALFVTLIFMGALGFFTAFIMLYLMRERRGPVFDRRQFSMSVSFADRRCEPDRRA